MTQPEPQAAITRDAEIVELADSIVLKKTVLELLDSIDEMLERNEVTNARKRIAASRKHLA